MAVGSEINLIVPVSGTSSPEGATETILRNFLRKCRHTNMT